MALGCRGLFSQPLTFRAEAGSQYWIQVAGSGSAASSIRIDLVEAPPPVASFFFAPGDPSMFDTVQFFENTFDPAGNGIQSRSWDFGDGTSLPDAPCCSTTHRYARDGTYQVQLTVTTSDGRSASVMRDVVVATHDVVITKVSVPVSARVGNTKTIVIGVVNTRYPENVTVQLLRSANGGWEEVARSTQYVAPRTAHKTTDFQFNYTFSPADAQLGKVNFQAVAVIVGARDAIPTDNTFISLPVKVTG
jgi:PKD repeat protein